MSDVRTAGRPVVFFEAPHRILKTLAELQQAIGDRYVAVGRELTKLHQEFHRGTSASLLERLGTPKGEFTVVVGPALIQLNTPEMPTDAILADELGETAESKGLGRRAALSAMAKKYGRPTRELYAAIERAKTDSGRSPNK